MTLLPLFLSQHARGYIEMSSILADQQRPSYISPNAGGGGELRGLSQRVQLYTGAQTNLGDLTQYLTYDSTLAYTVWGRVKVLQVQIQARHPAKDSSLNNSNEEKQVGPGLVAIVGMCRSWADLLMISSLYQTLSGFPDFNLKSYSFFLSS